MQHRAPVHPRIPCRVNLRTPWDDYRAPITSYKHRGFRLQRSPLIPPRLPIHDRNRLPRTSFVLAQVAVHGGLASV